MKKYNNQIGRGWAPEEPKSVLSFISERELIILINKIFGKKTYD